jgi:hypothetical protein
MYYSLSDGRYHVFVRYKGGCRPANEEFDTPGEASAFLRGLEHLYKSDRHFHYEILTLVEYETDWSKRWRGRR